MAWTRRAMLGGMVSMGLAPPTRAVPPGWLITNGYAITMDDRLGDLPRCDVRVVDGRIVEIGQGLSRAGATVIEADGAILMPGFVDTHCHMWNQIARDWARSDQGGFGPTMKRFAPLWSPQDAALSVRIALADAVSSGITTAHNWAHNTRSPAQARAEYRAHAASGVRGRFAYGCPQDLPPDRVMDLVDLRRMTTEVASPLVSLGVCLRGPDRSAEPVWRQEWGAALKLGLPITTHTSYDAASVARRPIRQLADARWLGPNTLLVHATAADDADLRTMAAAHAPLSISPWTELAVGYGVPPVARMVAAGVPISLSNDNVLLAGRIDMFAVMKLALDLAVGQAQRQDVVTERSVLRWATIDGARALGLGERIGSITQGKDADLILVRPARSNGPVDISLVNGSRPEDVELVMVGGAILKRDGHLTSVDRSALVAEGVKRMAALIGRAGVKPPGA